MVPSFSVRLTQVPSTMRPSRSTDSCADATGPSRWVTSARPAPIAPTVSVRSGSSRAGRCTATGVTVTVRSSPSRSTTRGTARPGLSRTAVTTCSHVRVRVPPTDRTRSPLCSPAAAAGAGTVPEAPQAGTSAAVAGTVSRTHSCGLATTGASWSTTPTA